MVGRGKCQRSCILRLAVPFGHCIADDGRNLASFLACIEYFGDWIRVLADGYRFEQLCADRIDGIFATNFARCSFA